MATVIWTDKAKKVRRRLYIEGVINFGIYTALKVVNKIESITDKLERFPKMGHKEQLLGKRTLIYRACHINKRFKIIYWYDDIKDMVVIEDIWDTHRAPQNLIKRVIE